MSEYEIKISNETSDPYYKIIIFILLELSHHSHYVLTLPETYLMRVDNLCGTLYLLAVHLQTLTLTLRLFFI